MSYNAYCVIFIDILIVYQKIIERNTLVGIVLSEVFHRTPCYGGAGACGKLHEFVCACHYAYVIKWHKRNGKFVFVWLCLVLLVIIFYILNIDFLVDFC